MNQNNNWQAQAQNRLCGQPSVNVPRPAPGAAPNTNAANLQQKRQPVAPPVYRPPLAPKAAQPKLVTASRNLLVAPPAYRPQPLPRVLQTKVAVDQHSPAGQPVRNRVAPPVYRPGSERITQAKTAVGLHLHLTKAPPIYRPQPTPRVLQTKNSRATEIAPDRYPPTTSSAQRSLHQENVRTVAQRLQLPNHEKESQVRPPARASNVAGPAATIQRKIVFTNVLGDDGSYFLQRLKRDKFEDLLNSREMKLLETMATDEQKYPFELNHASVEQIAFAVKWLREEFLLEHANKSRARELKKLKNKSKVVSSFLKLEEKAVAPKQRTLKVGVTFRTDGRGLAHKDHDMKAIGAIRALPGIGKLLGLEYKEQTDFAIQAVALPRGASGEESPVRIAVWKDLDDIDLLYIPGAPTANDQQVGSNSEETLFNKPQQPTHPGEPPELKLEAESNKAAKGRNQQATQKHKKALLDHQTKLGKYQKELTTYLRVLKEHRERAAYELRLIEIARNRGIPVLAICAGSWRLLESYGGQVETLPKAERDVHKAANPQDTWNLSHGITVDKSTAKKSTMLSGLMNKKGVATVLTDANSTHWAVASIDKTGQLVQNQDQVKLGKLGQKPSQLLEVSAKASGEKVKIATVEAFESKHGAPTLGIQWHPETALPGMLGENSGTVETQNASKKIFEFMAMSALTSQRRRTGVVKAIESIAKNIK